MRYEDLVFEPHPVFGPVTPRVRKVYERLMEEVPRSAFIWQSMLESDVECALAEFPNGWSLSVLRGEHGPLLKRGFPFETARIVKDCLESGTTRHLTVESVQRELDDVEGLPVWAGR